MRGKAVFYWTCVDFRGRAITTGLFWTIGMWAFYLAGQLPSTRSPAVTMVGIAGLGALFGLLYSASMLLIVKNPAPDGKKPGAE